jgi:hypothetical protein
MQKSKTQGLKRPLYCPFLLCHAQKWTWRCSGIYTCEYLSPLLLSCYHTSVDETIWNQIQESQREVKFGETDTARRNAYRYALFKLLDKCLLTAFSFYQTKTKLFARGMACIDQLPSCKPVFKHYPYPVSPSAWEPVGSHLLSTLECPW